MSLNEYSILDKISDSLAPVLRKLSDNQSKIFGTKTTLLRITRVVKPYYKQNNNIQEMSVLGDFKERYESHILDSIQIKYPFNSVEFFQSKNKPIDAVPTSPLVGIDLQEILPIEAEIRFEGTYDSDPISIVRGDKLCDVLFDHKLNPMPIILTVEKFLGNFFGKNIVSKKCTLSLHRGALNTELKQIVDEYVERIVDEKRSIKTRREKEFDPRS